MEASRVARTETPTKFLAVIEDDPDNQLLIKTILTTSGLDTKST
jgi:hypothetical protein